LITILLNIGYFRRLESGDLVALFVAEKREERASRQYGFNSLSVQLNELHEQHKGYLPHTDTRFRPDIRSLENHDLKKAKVAKKELEQVSI
jgi:hypothetical protein